MWPARPSAIALALVSISVPAHAASQGPSLSVLGGYRVNRTENGRAVEWRTLLQVTVPLDRFVTPEPWAHPGGPGEREGASESAEARNAAGERSDAGHHESTEPARGSREPDARSSEVAISPVLARQLVDAALRHAGYDAVDRHYDELSRRSRSSAGLPELRLRGGRSIDESLRLSPTSADPFRYTQAGGADLFFEARLTWDLDRLVFSGEELAIERLRRQRAADRLDRIQQVLEVLFTWQRARLEEEDEARLPEERALARLRRLQAAIELDVLTGGWFSEHVAVSAPSAPGAPAAAEPRPSAANP